MLPYISLCTAGSKLPSGTIPAVPQPAGSILYDPDSADDLDDDDPDEDLDL